MRTMILSAALVGALAAPALADSYPVSGPWGQSASSEPGAINCGNRRVISFNGNQRTDSGGGVSGYRNKTVQPAGPARYRIVDVFTNGQVNNAQVSYTLRLVDADHIELSGQVGTLKLQRCE